MSRVTGAGFSNNNPRWCVEFGRAGEGLTTYAADRRRLRQLIRTGARAGFKVERVLARGHAGAWIDRIDRRP